MTCVIRRQEARAREAEGRADAESQLTRLADECDAKVGRCAAFVAQPNFHLLSESSPCTTIPLDVCLCRFSDRFDGAACCICRTTGLRN